VANPEWGTKRICQNCGTKFYDLLREPIRCPKCQTEYDPEAFLKTRRSRTAPVADKEAEAPHVAVAEVEDAEVLEEDEEAASLAESTDEEDEDVIEDASELGEDEDDMAEVIENVDEEEER
jgi:uncharacterized protein (TIGR02300 family)